ncbi:GDSL esterase/lipase [Carex littledalei]|uniref:GDSL esterase/lipase n=1 Tax=Carex littledalei TaxID=544730 RepID=A0A833QRU8_9POAL|nr:GDSL esterase/lipase [Carex littledalei]
MHHTGANAQGLVPALYVLGDSLVDVGNNNHLELSLVKADFPHNGIDYPGKKATGRFSNGYNFADFMAQNLGVPTSIPYLSLSPDSNNTDEYLAGVSFASGGAGVLNNTNSGKCISFDEQIDYFATVYGVLVQQLGAEKTLDHLSKSIFAVVIGSNELIKYAKSDPATSTSPEDFVASLVATLQDQLKRMYNTGARRFVFIGTGPVGCCPALRERNETKECNEVGNDVSTLYNRGVSSLLNEMKESEVDMSYSFFDTNKAVLQYISQPSNYGFQEVADACCGLGDMNAKIACLPISTYCSNRSDHIFWDYYHPTETTARMVTSVAFDGSAPFVYPINIKQLSI